MKRSSLSAPTGARTRSASFHLVRSRRCQRSHVRPNGLAYDHVRSQVVVANVGDPARSGLHTLTVVDVNARAVRAEIPVSGRTRWAVFDPDAQAFYVNIADPAEIVVVDARKPQSIAPTFAVPSIGPHGLDLDLDSHRLFQIKPSQAARAAIEHGDEEEIWRTSV